MKIGKDHGNLYLQLEAHDTFGMLHASQCHVQLHDRCRRQQRHLLGHVAASQAWVQRDDANEASFLISLQLDLELFLNLALVTR